jgi:hypothetical protein
MLVPFFLFYRVLFIPFQEPHVFKFPILVTRGLLHAA